MVDPAAPLARDFNARTAERLAELERRVAGLERGNPTIAAVAGMPTTSPRVGTPAVDTAQPRLWLYRAGQWQYVTLTPGP